MARLFPSKHVIRAAAYGVAISSFLLVPIHFQVDCMQSQLVCKIALCLVGGTLFFECLRALRCDWDVIPTLLAFISIVGHGLCAH